MQQSPDVVMMLLEFLCMPSFLDTIAASLLLFSQHKICKQRGQIIKVKPYKIMRNTIPPRDHEN